MAQLLDGKLVRNEIAQALIVEIQTLARKPHMAILEVGTRPDSEAYIKQKKIFAEKIGVEISHKHFEETVTEKELLSEIHACNTNPEIDGIILQIPLPKHLNKLTLIEAVDPRKDVDGLTSTNTKLLYDNSKDGLMPATTRGILTLLKYYKIKVKGKRVLMVGRSALVGKPTAIAFLNQHATVTVAHRHSKNLVKLCNEADIIVVAVGKPGLITKEHVKAGQVVIDVGITSVEGRLVGDVVFSDVEPIVAALTPVPGGVGPMTVASLFQNVLQAYHITT
jgi:methylenetetrahydrofolate dehydrogenase (NADP+) / methenyltetrahydrofolate cyclohydrolase